MMDQSRGTRFQICVHAGPSHIRRRLMRFRSVLTVACALTAFIAAPRTARAQTPIRFSGAAALALPVGDLGDAADVGFNLSLRGEGKLGSPNWYLRGDLGWD